MTAGGAVLLDMHDVKLDSPSGRIWDACVCARIRLSGTETMSDQRGSKFWCTPWTVAIDARRRIKMWRMYTLCGRTRTHGARGRVRPHQCVEVSVHPVTKWLNSWVQVHTRPKAKRRVGDIDHASTPCSTDMVAEKRNSPVSEGESSSRVSVTIREQIAALSRHRRTYVHIQSIFPCRECVDKFAEQPNTPQTRFLWPYRAQRMVQWVTFRAARLAGYRDGR